MKQNKGKTPIHSYVLLPKLFLVLAIVFFMWIVVVISGPIILGWSSNWAGLSISLWIIIISVLIGMFIILDIILYLRPVPVGNEAFFQDVATTDVSTGLYVHNYTYPSEAKGGLFSKTYVKIDDTNVIRIRNQMVSADKLWEKKKKDEKEI